MCDADVKVEESRTILKEIADKKYPSLRRMAYGYALALLYNMMDKETELLRIRAVPRALDALLDLGRSDAAFQLFVNLCEEYSVELAPSFLQYAGFSPLVKSFIVELHICMRDELKELKPTLIILGYW